MAVMYRWGEVNWKIGKKKSGRHPPLPPSSPQEKKRPKDQQQLRNLQLQTIPKQRQKTNAREQNHIRTEQNLLNNKTSIKKKGGGGGGESEEHLTEANINCCWSDCQWLFSTATPRRPLQRWQGHWQWNGSLTTCDQQRQQCCRSRRWSRGPALIPQEGPLCWWNPTPVESLSRLYHCHPRSRSRHWLSPTFVGCRWMLALCNWKGDNNNNNRYFFHTALFSN